MAAPVELSCWTLRCDRASCIVAISETAAYDDLAARRVRARARVDGWQVGDGNNVRIPDLCPRHAREGA